MEKALAKAMELRDQYGGMISQMSGMLPGAAGGAEGIGAMLAKLEDLHELIVKVNAQFRDPAKTTFVCVSIAEFLSVVRDWWWGVGAFKQERAPAKVQEEI